MKETKIALTCHEGVFVFDKEKIVMCEVVKNYTTFHFADGSHKTLSCTLGKIEKQLENEFFFKVNISNLINVKLIEKICNDSEDKIILSNEREIPISKKKKKELIDYLKANMVFISSNGAK
jgi:two-component system LytT family response regulator